MTITRADVAALGRRAMQPTKADGEILAVWVSGKLVNTKNARMFWASEMRYKQGWRERVAMALLEAGWNERDRPHPSVPKGITFTCHVHNLMDSVDGLRVACAPITDALKQCGVISDDADAHGHAFVFKQQVDRKQRGVVIRVRLAPAAERINQ